MRRSALPLLMMCCFALVSQAQETCATTLLETGETTQTLQVGERERTFIRYVPQTDSDEPFPLLLVFHGFDSNAIEMVELTGFNELADDEGFVVIYLDGTNDPTQWYNGTSLFLPQDDPRDLDFVTALLDDYKDSPCINPSKIYATGFSMGGGMVHRLACEMSDRFAAVATVSGAYANIPDGCNPQRGVPLLTIHGLADRVVPFEGVPFILPNIGDWVAGWGERNECTSSEALPVLGNAAGTSYTNCKDDSVVEIYTIPDGEHTWAGTTMGGIVSSEVIWAFFERYELIVIG